MAEYSIDSFSIEDAFGLIRNNVDAVLVADGKENRIRTLLKKGILDGFLDDSWSYHQLVEHLWYHVSEKSLVDNYKVFIPSSGKIKGKYSRRVNLTIDGKSYVVQLTVYPLAEDFYLYLLDELDESYHQEEEMTDKKVRTIENVYLFSMYIDVVRDTTSSITLSEISEKEVNQQLKYTEWRKMIVNMFAQEYQQQFLEESDPEMLKKKYAPGHTSSFDCLMMNLEGKYIWVKLIFSRSETSNNDDYRFVFMVQNIHENSMELHDALKKYEKLASVDSLTRIYNHGRIETELNNAVAQRGRGDREAAIMMLDIDFFKAVNDEYGHSVGDITLTHFAKTLRAGLNEQKMVLGRWGGEEFALVCYDASLEEAKELGEALRKRVEAETFEKIGNITCSVGITQIRPDDTFDSAFERMDQALYKAKSDGRNCVRVL